jgi:hypothetical protein
VKGIQSECCITGSVVYTSPDLESEEETK